MKYDKKRIEKMEYDKRCVCYSEVRNKCTAITEHQFNLGHHCSVCVFRKTAEEYERQAGHSYKDAMKELEKYERKYHR